MDTILDNLIRIAHANPELRAEILPVVKEAKGLAKTPEAAKRMWEKYKKKNPGTRKQPADFYEKPEEGESRREKSDKEKTKADEGKEKTEDRQKKVKKKVQREIGEKDRKAINEKVKGMSVKELSSKAEKFMKEWEAKTPEEALKKLKDEVKEYKSRYRTQSIPEGYYNELAILSRFKKEKSKKNTQRNQAKGGKKVLDLADKHGLSQEALKKLKSFTKKRFKKLREDQAKAERQQDLRERSDWRTDSLSEEERKEMFKNWGKDTNRRDQKAKSPAELKREFMNNTDPETRKRILKMSPAEFEAMMAAIMEEEDGKQASLTKASAWAGEFTYQVVTDGNKVQRYSEKDFMRKFRSKIVGYTPEGGRLREELWEQPKVRGLLGPMWNGIQGGKAEIRYEDQATYKRMSLASSKVAHRPYLTSEGLDSRKVNKGEGFMLYMIDQAKNHSKFYEGVMLDNGDGTYRVLLRWGALTDSGFTGRIDGAKFDGRMSVLSEREAKAVLMKKYRDKTRKGYVDAFKHKLSKGQYPVGLKRDVGFGWGTQDAAFCIPALRRIRSLLSEASQSLTQMQFASASDSLDMASELAMRDLRSEDSSMAKKILDNITHMQDRASKLMAGDVDSSAIRNWKTALNRLMSYLDKQLSVCHTASRSTLTANDKLRYTRLAASLPKGSAQRMAALQVLLGE